MITVSELITELKKLNQSAVVLVLGQGIHEGLQVELTGVSPIREGEVLLR